MIADYSNRTVGEYLDALASSAPAPGGGSAVAFAGALAASLAEMVCRLSIGRVEASDVDAELHVALETASSLRGRLQQLAAEDAAAYASYVAATGLPKSSAEEQAERRTRMQAALRTAADVPSDIAAACSRLFDMLEPIGRLGNRHVLSDVEVAAFLTAAAIRGATANIRVNARLMRDREIAQGYLDRATEIESGIQPAADEILAIVQRRLGHA
ncbi:MAG: cyclodeaminase/cyclohydrolase family protein [Thermomicrobiales bacterium]